MAEQLLHWQTKTCDLGRHHGNQCPGAVLLGSASATFCALCKHINNSLQWHEGLSVSVRGYRSVTGYHYQQSLNIDCCLLLPISERIKYKVTCMCFSAINGSGPAYLSELLHVYTPSHTLHSSSDTRMLEIQQYKRKTHGFRTFSCFGPPIWNSLPQDTAQPGHLLKPNWKPFSSHSISILFLTNISTQFLLQSVCVCVCVCVCL